MFKRAMLGLSLSLMMGSIAFTQPAPAEPARRQPATRGADSPADSPDVTCWSWAIGDARTGQLLWGSDANTPRKSASTTKLMCVYVVAGLAEKDPSILEERVTFSEAADKTSGSTSDVKAGESLTVAECLYGLLLPSGNDAGIALAEHFNDRFAPPEVAPQTVRAYTNFVAEMNREAARLGMKNTTYRIPYGDGGSADDRTTTAADLVTLASAAMKHDLIRKYVGTREHAGQVTTADGQPRTIEWKNTNRLLANDWCDGVKTGTTTLARSCLVSSVHRGDDHLIVVVLGSDGNDNRYNDTETLLGWAWQKRGR